MANYHVSGNRSNGYNVKREHNEKATAHFDTKEKAEARAKELAGKTGGGEVRLHGPDGKIKDNDTVKPGKDPNPPKDSVH